MNYKTFLIELQTEEIPAQYIREIAKNFYENFLNQLNQNKIHFSKINLFDSPRRIALQINKISTLSIKKNYCLKGPSVENSFDHHGNLKIPASSWLKKLNIQIKDTTILKTKKGKWLIYKKYEIISLKSILMKIFLLTLKNIKTLTEMSWNEHNIKFIRPIRNIIILLDDQIIPFNKFGFSIKKYLYGNIFTIFKKIKINHAKEYEHILYKYGKVIAKFSLRKKKIQYQSEKLAYQLNGKIKLNPSLLNEISCLVEYPKILYGKFKKIFLKIPKEILIYVMESMQKYLPIYNIYTEQLQPYFIIVANTNSIETKNIIYGNERVLTAKLSDVLFFLNQDYKLKLQEYLPLLKKIIFYEKLGNLFDKTKRNIILIKNVIQYTKSNINDSIRCAYLSKCDLKTYMVYEFPKLKGIIGMYYSLYHNEPQNISIALKEQYQPNFLGDQLPSSILGCTLSLTDKIDTLVGLFLINIKPKQDKDPFFLRRLSIGIIRIIIEKKININLKKIINISISSYNFQNIPQNINDNIFQFILYRLYSFYKKKYDTKIINSIFEYYKNNLLDMDNNIKYLNKLQKKKCFIDIITTYKRINNLIKKNKIKKTSVYQINEKLFQNKKEQLFFIKIKKSNDMIEYLIKKKKYKKNLIILSILQKFINSFLDNHYVEHKIKNVTINRISLLIKIKKIFLKVINFNEL
ncbi:glycine--tRNA ligase subunit beta [Buchnera aphidicola]|uniref:glycine--tRNA ligase subunit beta n=1 Tax=Buchnera aphidicola TaxID=9 RepID=UPI00346466E3